jgi:signal transduction histidine kinase
VSARKLRWNERLALLSELLTARTDRWENLPSLLAELALALGYARLDFSWPVVPNPEVSVSSTPSPERISISPELIEKIQGKSEAVLLDPQFTSRRYATVRVPPHSPGVLMAESTEPWTEEDEALLSHLGTVLGRSPWLANRIGSADRFLIDRLNDGATLAGRLAHDYDNLWTGILGFAELTLSALRPGSNEQQYIQEVATIGQRGIAMTAQLHQFSRSGAVKPMPSSVGAVITREQTRIKQSTNGRVRWSVEVPAILPPVTIEAGSLAVVLGHLLDNAIESMPNGGPLKVHAELIDLSPTEARNYLGDVRAGSHVVVRITDSGSGIKDEVKAKLFHQPFFTTKTRHRGLGLAIVYRTLFVHRGGLTIESEGEKGTTVRVALPLTAAPPAVNPVTERPTNTTHTGGR